MTIHEFLEHCYACGGNLTAMLMSGIKNAFPEYYDSMEDRSYEFNEIMSILENDLGVQF